MTGTQPKHTEQIREYVGFLLALIVVGFSATIIGHANKKIDDILPYGEVATLTSTEILKADVLNKWRKEGGFTKTHVRGSQGKEVQYIQQYLSLLYPGMITTIDGVYGKQTIEAMKLLQAEHHIFASGLVDKETLELLNTLFTEELCPRPTLLYPELLLFPVSKIKNLPDGYVPPDLVVLPDSVEAVGIICMRQGAAQAYQQLYSAAKNSGLRILVTSGFRKFGIQDYLKELYNDTLGEKQSDKVSAHPGHSEHQLGTAIDITGASIGFGSTSTSFEGSPEWYWMASHAQEYGFVLSYEYGKESVTGYQFEPWHWRYVGVDLAKEIYTSGKTSLEILEEKWELTNVPQDS